MDCSSFSQALSSTCKEQSNNQFVDCLIQCIESCVINRKLICIFGNGGSSADSQHFAGELICTYQDRNRPPIPAISLSSNSSVITAWANDFSYDTIFSRQLLAFSGMVGVAIGLSTSGQSPNVVSGLVTANSINAETFLFTSTRCESSVAKNVFKAHSSKTGEIQQIHEYVYHLICESLDERLSVCQIEEFNSK